LEAGGCRIQLIDGDMDGDGFFFMIEYGWLCSHSAGNDFISLFIFGSC
jgi:hypothetical protein